MLYVYEWHKGWAGPREWLHSPGQQVCSTGMSTCTFAMLMQTALTHIANQQDAHQTLSLESIRSTFVLNVEWSCDWKNNVNVHCKRSVVKVILDQRTYIILPYNLILLALNIHCKSLVVKEILDQHTDLSVQPCPISCMDFSSVENDLQCTYCFSWLDPVCCVLCMFGNGLGSECYVMLK